MHTSPCIPIIKDAESYVLKDCLGDLMSFLRNCCGFGLPVPYNSFYMCSSKSCLGPQKSAALGAPPASDLKYYS